MASLLITAPHVGCFSLPLQRHCDQRARAAAEDLYSRLISQSRLLLGQVYRPYLDLNRDIAMRSPFREAIREIISQEPIRIILDIHSYPDNPENPFSSYDIVILDEKPGTDYGRDITSYLREVLSYRVGYFIGEGNSIMTEMRELGYPAILVEYGEFLEDEEITTINSALVEWLLSRTYVE